MDPEPPTSPSSPLTVPAPRLSSHDWSPFFPRHRLRSWQTPRHQQQRLADMNGEVVLHSAILTIPDRGRVEDVTLRVVLHAPAHALTFFKKRHGPPATTALYANGPILTGEWIDEALTDAVVLGAMEIRSALLLLKVPTDGVCGARDAILETLGVEADLSTNVVMSVKPLVYHCPFDSIVSPFSAEERMDWRALSVYMLQCCRCLEELVEKSMLSAEMFSPETDMIEGTVSPHRMLGFFGVHRIISMYVATHGTHYFFSDVYPFHAGGTISQLYTMPCGAVAKRVGAALREIRAPTLKLAYSTKEKNKIRKDAEKKKADKERRARKRARTAVGRPNLLTRASDRSVDDEDDDNNEDVDADALIDAFKPTVRFDLTASLEDLKGGVPLARLVHQIGFDLSRPPGLPRPPADFSVPMEPLFFNMFRGFYYSAPDMLTAAQRADVSRLGTATIDLLRPFVLLLMNLCGTQQRADVVLDVIGCALVSPELRPGLAIIMCGKPGTGKNMFFESIVGELFRASTPPGDATGSAPSYSVSIMPCTGLDMRFNSRIENKLWVVLNEQDPKTMRSTMQTCKTMITDPTFTSEKKYKEAYDSRMMATFVFLTNTMLPIEIDDRRFMAFHVDTRMPEDFYEAMGGLIKAPPGKHIQWPPGAPAADELPRSAPSIIPRGVWEDDDDEVPPPRRVSSRMPWDSDEENESEQEAEEETDLLPPVAQEDEPIFPPAVITRDTIFATLFEYIRSRYINRQRSNSLALNPISAIELTSDVRKVFQLMESPPSLPFKFLVIRAVRAVASCEEGLTSQVMAAIKAVKSLVERLDPDTLRREYGICPVTPDEPQRFDSMFLRAVEWMNEIVPAPRVMGAPARTGQSPFAKGPVYGPPFSDNSYDWRAAAPTCFPFATVVDTFNAEFNGDRCKRSTAFADALCRLWGVWGSAETGQWCSSMVRKTKLVDGTTGDAILLPTPHMIIANVFLKR